MDLWRGITGFFDADDPSLPSTDFKKFTEHCYAAARAVGASMRKAESPESKACGNFGRAILETSHWAVSVLVNAHYPVVAFAKVSDTSETEMRFVDAPELAETFKVFGGYEVLASFQVRRRVVPEDCLQLSRAEREQLRYWRPKIIGEIVFNHWD